MSNVIGFIGLGIMGKPMAKNLLKGGYHLVVYDRVLESMNELIILGAEESSSPADVANRAQIIITMLPNGPEVREVVTGENGILKGVKVGSILIDMSSIAPRISREMNAICKKNGVRFMDAPVSGGETKAIEGTLAIMVGCDSSDFEAYVPLLRLMGGSVVRTGEIGSGNITKLANQIIVALNIAAISEAYVLATKAGVNPQLVFDSIKEGLAGSNVMNSKIPMILDRNFSPGFKLKLHIKDLTNAIETGLQVGAPMPFTIGVLGMMQSLLFEGKGDCDHATLIEFYEHLAGTKVLHTTETEQ